MFRRLPQQGGSPRDVAEIVNKILDGKINSVKDITFDSSNAPETFLDERVSDVSIILLMPKNSAATQLVGHIYVSSTVKGAFTLDLRSGHGAHIAEYRYVVIG